MKLEIINLRPLHCLEHLGHVHLAKLAYENMGTGFKENIFWTCNEIEDFENQLMMIVKQLQDYRMKQNAVV